MYYLVLTLYLFPKNLISYLLGAIVRIKFPSILAHWFNQLFVFLFGIDMSEAEKPLYEYRTIEEVFTRGLKPEKRDIELFL